MKKLILLALVIVPALVWAQDGTFTLKAKIGTEKAPAQAYLIYPIAGKYIIDSALLDNGAFTFKGTLAEPTSAQLVMDHHGVGLAKLRGKPGDLQALYLDKGTITVNGKDSAKTAIITGSSINEAYKKFILATSPPDKVIARINADYAAATAAQKNDQAFVAGLQARLSKANEEKKALLFDFAKKNPTSYIGLVALTQFAGDVIDAEQIEPVFKTLPAAIQNTHLGVQIAKAIASTRATAIGAIAPLFIQNDVNDKPVSLASFKGKYVLLDFWASWCGPCRKENPNVVKAYHQYKDKNFTVLGVSLDMPGKKADWLAAVKADRLEWTQVSDLRYSENAVAKLYGINAIPQNYLIDPNGKIIGKNLRGDELAKKLASIFN
ncbi:redoxin domain-containing protein [Mucilaginibacter sp. UYCu711]|uniref:redoxin domain-containing protein n=1 Tax=Mucilaginibacter sp. UYCu711 TaxID=3156339 RepID=UPI003D1DFB54